LRLDNHYQAFANPRAAGQVAGIQTGIDVWRGSLIPGHSDTAGLYLAYGNVDGLVTNPAATAYILQHTRSLNLNAYSVGATETIMVPAVRTSMRCCRARSTTALRQRNLPACRPTGRASPPRWRWSIRSRCHGSGRASCWNRRPDHLAAVFFDDANDGLGPVGLGTTSGAQLGLRGKWIINDPAGRVWHLYVLANVWRDFAASATTMLGLDPVPLLEQTTRLEFAGGLGAKILHHPRRCR
jgi:hypothetical protein